MSKQSRASAMSQLEDSISELHIWFCYNGLAYNPDRTNIILLGSSQQAKTLPPTSIISVAGTPISISNNIKFLSITFDKTLAFNNHIYSIYPNHALFTSALCVISVHQSMKMSSRWSHVPWSVVVWITLIQCFLMPQPKSYKDSIESQIRWPGW